MTVQVPTRLVLYLVCAQSWSATDDGGTSHHHEEQPSDRKHPVQLSQLFFFGVVSIVA